jgi:hypothetical protein
MCFFTVEDKSGRERTTQFSETLQSTLPTLIAANFELAAARYSNLDVVAFFQLERLDDGGG